MDPNNPPTGIPPLLWLLVILVGGPATFGVLVSSVGARLPGALGALGRWWQARDAAHRAEAQRTASYEAQDHEIGRLKEQYDRITADYKELVARMDELDEKLTRSNRRLFAALDHIRDQDRISRRLDPENEPLPVPDLLKEYL
mgnify:FL=1